MDIEKTNVSSVKARTTDAQKEIWAAAALGDLENLAYNESITIEIEGTLDPSLLHRALVDLCQRHESLRTIFSEDGEYFQVLDSIHFPYTVVEGLTDATELSAIKYEAASVPFDLVKGPLFKAVVCFDAERTYLTVTAHHIVCDGWSFGVIANDLSQLYTAHLTGQPASLPPATQYREYAALEETKQKSPEYQKSVQYWQEQYSTPPELMELPHDGGRPKLRSFGAGRLDHALDAAMIKKLRKFGAKEKASAYVSLLAAYKILLWKIMGQDDIVIATPAAGQTLGGHYEMVGHAVNTLALRSQMDPLSTFRNYTKSLRTTVLDGFDHQRITLRRLLEAANIPFDPSRVPLSPVIFNVDQKIDSSKTKFGPHRSVYFSNPRIAESFEIFINISETDGDFLVECQYNEDLYSKEFIQSHLESFETLIESIIRNPDLSIKDLPWAPRHQLEKLYFDWNQNNLELPHDSFITLFEEQTSLFPDKEAVSCLDESLTYQELNQKVNQLAHHLVSLGVKRGDFVGVNLSRSIDMLISTLGIMKAGACYIPMDPSYPADRIAYMLENSGCLLVVSEPAHKDNLPQSAHTQIIDLIALQDHLSSLSTANLLDKPAKHDLAYVIYTSGSTGKPKGVKVPHGAVTNLLMSIRNNPGLNPEDRLLAVTTLSFDIAVLELYTPLITGATVVIATSDMTLDGYLLMDEIDRKQINFMQATPSTWRLLVECDWQGKEQFKGISGGEPLSQKLAHDILDRIETLYNYYGPTETTVWSTGTQVVKDKPIVIGPGIHNTTIYVRDRFGLASPLYMPGELFIGGTGVTAGYLNRDDLTVERFVNIPGVPELSKIYRTGDLVRLDQQGSLTFIRRIDNQVKVRGFRIELGEVESLAPRGETCSAAVLSSQAAPPVLKAPLRGTGKGTFFIPE